MGWFKKMGYVTEKGTIETLKRYFIHGVSFHYEDLLVVRWEHAQHE
jgi:hypothetical protein